MASKTTKTTAPEVEANAEATAPESTYTIKELVENHKAFNTYREIVSVALRLAGKESATFAEAKKIIENFKNKEVK